MLHTVTATKSFSSLVSLLKGLKAALPNTEERNRRLQDHVVGALRALYFPPRESLACSTKSWTARSYPVDRTQCIPPFAIERLIAEAYASLAQLLRLTQICSNRWDDLTAKVVGTAMTGTIVGACASRRTGLGGPPTVSGLP